MPTSPLSVVLQHLLADLRPDGDGRTDGELLARFLRSRDEDALAALVRRHAPMVWGVCSRLLNHHDAEDAFQATFLVLVRKATDVPRQAVANWLYGVARMTAVRLRATATKRRRRETQVVNMPEPTMPTVRDADLERVVDEELSRLPDHYRGVVVLCDLEGITRREAARQLGIPEGSVASRLARAWVMLAKRLTQRGVVFSGGSVAAVLSGSASASAPPVLVASTIKAASLLAAWQTAGVVSAKVAALTEGVVKAMFVTKIKSVLAVVLVVGLGLGGIGAGIGLSTNPEAVGQGRNPSTANSKPPTGTTTVTDGQSGSIVVTDVSKSITDETGGESDEAKARQRWLKETPGTNHPGGYYPARFETDGPKGELRLIPFRLRSMIAKANGGYPYVVAIAFTPKIREQFRRIGISDLESHLRGKNVLVRAKVASCWLADTKYPQVRLVVDDISQIEGVGAIQDEDIKRLNTN